jgi:hypothetical protein
MDGDLNQMSVVSKSDDWGKVAALPRSQQGDDVKKQDKRVPQYVRRLQYLHTIGVIPRAGVAKVDIYHDGWCAHFQGWPCNCVPEVKVRWTQPATAQN